MGLSTDGPFVAFGNKTRRDVGQSDIKMEYYFFVSCGW